MLVLSRKSGESIVIGDSIRVVVVQTSSGRVRLGIEAPRDLPVDREEVRRRIERDRQVANLAGQDLAR